MGRVSNTIRLDTGELDEATRAMQRAADRMEQLRGRGQRLEGRGQAARRRSRPGLGNDVTARGTLDGLREALTSGPALARVGIASVLTRLANGAIGLAGRRENGDTVREIVKDMIPSIADSVPIVGAIRQLAAEAAKRESVQVLNQVEARNKERDLERRLQEQPSLRREAARTAVKVEANSWERRRRQRNAQLKGLR